MRRKLVAANWKMNKHIAEAEAFASALSERAGADAPCDLVVIPPFLSVPAVAAKLSGTPAGVGAQDIFWEKSGAFTGEVSGDMIADAGARWVLVGHSERRHVLGESNAIVARKLTAALDSDLSPILCVGELLEEREAGDAGPVVEEQLDTALADCTPEDVEQLVIAYEPVWAIGTGATATPEDAEEMHAAIRAWIQKGFGSHVSEGLRIQYGGSVKPSNAADLMSRSQIDGALIGGASLEIESFLAIAEAAGTG